jgi:hypothetical protein
LVLADGFSCRTQIHELDSGGREAIHLAELLERAHRNAPRTVPGDLDDGDRPKPPPRAASLAAVAGAGAVAAGAVAALSRRRR